MLMDMESKKVVVTSGLGFISSNLVKKLFEKTYVIVIDNLLAHNAFKKINMEELTEIIIRNPILIDVGGILYNQVFTKLNNFFIEDYNFNN